MTGQNQPAIYGHRTSQRIALVWLRCVYVCRWSGHAPLHLLTPTFTLRIHCTPQRQLARQKGSLFKRSCVFVLERLDVQLLLHYCCGVPLPQCWKSCTACVFLYPFLKVCIWMCECAFVCVALVVLWWAVTSPLTFRSHALDAGQWVCRVYFLYLRWNLALLRHGSGLGHFVILLHGVDAKRIQNDKWKTRSVLGLSVEDGYRFSITEITAWVCGLLGLLCAWVTRNSSWILSELWVHFCLVKDFICFSF